MDARSSMCTDRPAPAAASLPTPQVLSPVSSLLADPSGSFIRHYVPALRNFPGKYIFEPWTAPKSVQEVSGTRAGTQHGA